MSSYNLHSAIIVTSESLYIYISLLQNPSQLKNIYFTLLFLVIKLLALYSIKYSLNYLSAYPIRNSPIYATWSATIGNFTPLCLIFSFIPYYSRYIYLGAYNLYIYNNLLSSLLAFLL